MLIDEVAKEFKELWGKNFGINCGSDDCTYTATFYGNNNLDEVDYIDGSNCTDIIKKAIKETINDDGFHIHECMQIYLDCDSTDESKQKLKAFYPIEEKNVDKYIDKYNSTAKYWKINISMTDIEDSGGWQFLEFPRYDLTDETIKSLKKELNQGDGKMTEQLKTTITVIKNGTIVSQEEDIFNFRYNLNKKLMDDNSHKADIIFNTLKPYIIGKDEYGYKYNLKMVNSISIFRGFMNSDKTYYPSKDNASMDTEGFEIFNTHIDRVVMLKCITNDNTTIRFDFQGLIDASDVDYHTHFNCNIKDYQSYPKKDYTIKKYLEKIDEEWDDCDCVYKALSLVLATQEQDKWDDIYNYITNIIKKMDEENGYSAETIRDEINFRETHPQTDRW